MTKILIVDDHFLIREGLRRALAATEFNNISEAATLAEAKIRFGIEHPQIAIVDLNLGSTSGLEFAEWVRGQSHTCFVIILTVDDRAQVLKKAKEVGVSAYVLKEAPINELIRALQFVKSHPHGFFSEALMKSESNSNFNLTERENEILALLPEGLTNREMASLLFLSEATVKTHLLNLYRKLQATNRVRAVEIARVHNLLPQ